MPAAKVTLSCNVVIGARPGVEAKASAQWWIFWYTRLHLGLIKVWVLEQRMATCSQKTKANVGICSSHGSLLFQKLAMNQSKCSCFKTVLTIYRSIYGLPWHWGTMLVPNWTHLWSVCTFWEPRRPVILNALRLALSYIACHFYVGSPGILYPFGPCRYYRHVWSCWHFATMWWFSLKHLDFPLQHTTWPPWIWGLYHLYHWPSTSQQKYRERCIACHLNHRNTFHFPIIIYLSNRLANLRLTRLWSSLLERLGSRGSCVLEAILQPALISTLEPHFQTSRMPTIFLPIQVFCYFAKINEKWNI